MANYERETPELATPEQAGLVLSDIADLAMMQGDGRRYRSTIGLAPIEVVAHFPSPDSTSDSVLDHLEAVQYVDPATGRPRETGTLALVTFTRDERRDAGLIYQTQVDYTVVADKDGVKNLKRFTLQRETGLHKRSADYAVGMAAMYGETGVQEAFQEAHEANLAMEDAMGIHDVTAAEATAITTELDSLKPISEQR